MLYLDSFKNKLYLLRVFGDPFNFNALFDEICCSEPDGPWTSLGILLEALQDEWPAPAASTQDNVEEPQEPSPPPAAALVPAPANAAPAAVPDYDDWEGEEDFEEDFQEPGTPEADDPREAIQQDNTHLRDEHRVSEEDDMEEDEIDYEEEDFENDSQPDLSPKKVEPPAFAPGPAAPVVHAKPPAPAPTSPPRPAKPPAPAPTSPAPAVAVAQPDDGYDEEFESDGEEFEPEEPEPDDDVVEQVDDEDDVDRGVISDEDEFEDDESIKSAED